MARTRREQIVAGLKAAPQTRTPQERNQLLQKKANRIWKEAAPVYGKSPDSKAPKIWQAPGLQRGEAETVDRGFDGAKRSGVKYSPKLATGLLSSKSNLSNTAKETLLHEWTHANQPKVPITPKNEWRVEGGAEALARSKAPGVYSKLGVKYQNPRFNGYPKFTREVNKKLGKRYVNAGQLKPLFSNENPGHDKAAFKHNQKWAKPSATNYQTALNPKQERHFQRWAKNKDAPLESGAHTQYDLKGYWLATKGKKWAGGDAHFPDAWKTPYDPTFSKWSKYAKKGTPFVWRKGNRLVNRKTGRVIYE